MLTASQLHRLVKYNPKTGLIFWNGSKGRAKPGSLANMHYKRGIPLISLDGHSYQAKRLVWLYMTGKWPNQTVACVNGDRSDLRWTNLREASIAQSRAFIPPRSKHGVKGVWITRHGRYVAEIRLARQKKYLGQFRTLEEASAAYAEAAKAAFGFFARPQ